MIMSYSDRVIRIYGWYNNSNSTISSSTNNNSNKTPGSSTATLNYSFQENGKLLLENSWEMSDLVSFKVISKL